MKYIIIYDSSFCLRGERPSQQSMANCWLLAVDCGLDCSGGAGGVNATAAGNCGLLGCLLRVNNEGMDLEKGSLKALGVEECS